MLRLSLLLILLCVGLSPAARAQAPATPAAVQVGDTYDDVVAKLGPPASEMNAGANRLLMYPNARIRIRNGQVTEIFPVAGGPVAAAPAPAPAAKPGTSPAAAAADGKGMAAGEVRTRKDAVESSVADFEFAVLQSFRKEDFAALEAQARQLIDSRAVFGDGSYKIGSFHQALVVPEGAPEPDWETVEGRIGRWENAMPDSVTARVAHVSFLTAYAWHARGGLSPLVKLTPEAAAKYDSRLEQAQGLLQSALKLPGKSQMIWFAGLDLALARHWAIHDTVDFYIEGKKFDPGFWYLDAKMALYLSPRWNGKPGDWEAFAQMEAKRQGGLGDEGYARTVYSMRTYYRNLFKETKVQWPPVRDGFQTLMKKYPESLQLVNEYAYMACNAGDREAARWAFDKLGNIVDPFIWSAESLKVFRAWAYQPQ